MYPQRGFHLNPSYFYHHQTLESPHESWPTKLLVHGLQVLWKFPLIWAKPIPSIAAGTLPAMQYVHRVVGIAQP